MSDVLHLDAASFDAAVAQGVILVDFWAEWCGPCRMLGPVLEQVAQEVAGKAKVAKVNVDECPDLAAKYQVRSIPALFIIKDGQIVKNFVGVKDKKTLVDAIAASL